LHRGIRRFSVWPRFRVAPRAIVVNAISVAALRASASSPVSQAARIFHDEGLVAVADVLPESALRPVTDFLVAALDRIAELFAKYEIALRDPTAGALVERLLDADAAKVPAEDKHVLLGHFPLTVRLDETLWRIPLALAEQPVLYEILGAKRLFVHMPPTARFVLPGNVNAAVPAHQDVSYNKHLGRFCVVWVPLVDIDRSCGGMAVFPRTQGRGELYRGATVAPSDGWIPPVDTSGFERIELQPLSPGDIVVMSDDLVHESMPNRSSRIRLSIDFRFFGENSRSTKHYLDLTECRVVAPGPRQ
jgi:hypothetical protein